MKIARKLEALEFVRSIFLPHLGGRLRGQNHDLKENQTLTSANAMIVNISG